MGTSTQRDEELAAIGIFSSIGHGQESCLGVTAFKVFIRKGFAINRKSLNERFTPLPSPFTKSPP